MRKANIVQVNTLPLLFKLPLAFNAEACGLNQVLKKQLSRYVIVKEKKYILDFFVIVQTLDRGDLRLPTPGAPW